MALCWVLLPTCVVSIAVAFAGLFVLSDTKQETWIGQTEFGAFYRKLIDWNPMCSNIMFNGGILGLMLTGSMLRKHHQGKLLQNVRFVSGKELNEARKQGVSGKKKRG